MGTFEVSFPEDYLAERGEGEIEAKGWLRAVEIRTRSKTYTVTFYDPGRLLQTIEDELRGES